MDFAAILQLVMSIIAMIMQLIGGGTFPGGLLTPNQNGFSFLASHQYQCGEPYWPQAAKVSGNIFSGSAAMDCTVQGAGGGGFIGLRNHLLNQMPESAVAATEPAMEIFEGMPSLGIDMRVEASLQNAIVPIDGIAHVATDGFTGLRSVFISDRVEGDAGKYLRNIRDELTVEPGSSQGKYKVRMLYSPKVAKPGLLNANTFKSQVMKGAEDTLRLRRDRVLNDIAGQL